MIDAAPSVFFIGDVSLDEYYAADRWPGVADKGYVREGRSYVGGMIANAASVYAGLGGRPQFISLLNNSPLSERLCRALAAGGVATDYMLHDPDMQDSRNLIFLVDGEHVVLTIDIGREPMHLSDAAVAALAAPGYVYTTLNRARRLRHAGASGPDLLKRLRQAGRRFVFDLDVEGFSPQDADYLVGAEVLIMNRIGFDNAFGRISIAELGQWMQDHAVGTVIRTLAAEGAEAFDGTTVEKVPGYAVPVADVTGAGDTFGGSLLFALTKGAELRTALDLAVAAASRSVTIIGPQGGVAALAEIDEFRNIYGAAPGGSSEDRT